MVGMPVVSEFDRAFSMRDLWTAAPRSTYFYRFEVRNIIPSNASGHPCRRAQIRAIQKIKPGSAATQLAVVVLDFPAAVEVAERSITPLAILLLAAGPQVIAVDLNVLAGLNVRAARETVPVVA